MTRRPACSRCERLAPVDPPAVFKDTPMCAHPLVQTQTIRCLNCDAKMPVGQAFCGVCGQKASTHRLSLHDITHAVVHVFTHTDGSVFSLARDLAHKPGRVAREYVAGKRRKYFNPFTFAIVVIGLAALVMAASGFVNLAAGAQQANPMSRLLQKHLNLLVLAQLPLLAVFCMAFFKSEKLHFTEHLVLAAYASAFRSIFFVVVVAGFWALTRWNYSATLLIYMGLWFSYFGVACAQFYSGNRWWLWLKGATVAALAQLVITAIVWGVFALWFGTSRAPQ
jgi:hypothetical protein